VLAARIGLFLAIVAPAMYDGTSAVGESRPARRLPELRLERDPASNAWIVRFDEVIQIEHNLLMPMHA
jgi:hypothetical protein